MIEFLHHSMGIIYDSANATKSPPLMTSPDTAQTLLRLIPASGNQPFHGDTWRKAVAAQVNATPLIQELAAYEDAEPTLRPIPEMSSSFPTRDSWPDESVKQLFHHEKGSEHSKPKVCFLSTKSWVGAVATGSDARKLLALHSMNFMMAASNSLGPCSAEMLAYELEAVPSEREYLYQISSLVGQGKDRAWTALTVRNRLLNGLNAWALENGLATPGKDKFDASEITMESVERISPAISQSVDMGKWARERALVRFYMPYNLKGWWFAGGQIGKGHGRISHISAKASKDDQQSDAEVTV